MSDEDLDPVEQTEDGPRDRPAPEPDSVWDIFIWIGFVLLIGGQALYRLLTGEREVGEFWWWSDVLAVVVGSLIIVLKIKGLIRDRDARASARAERWDPWG